MSCPDLIVAGVAQLVEQLIRNQLVKLSPKFLTTAFRRKRSKSLPVQESRFSPLTPQRGLNFRLARVPTEALYHLIRDISPCQKIFHCKTAFLTRMVGHLKWATLELICFTISAPLSVKKTLCSKEGEIAPDWGN